MKNIYIMGLGVAALLGSASALAADAAVKAPGTCFIYVAASAPCFNAVAAGPDAANYYKVNAWFGDTEPYANMNAGRCLERAQEYKSWCQNPVPAAPADGKAAAPVSSVTGAYAYYQVNGINVIGSYVGADNKTYLTDGVARWLRWHD